jgi:hypothetical protein
MTAPGIGEFKRRTRWLGDVSGKPVVGVENSAGDVRPERGERLTVPGPSPAVARA